MQAPELTIYEKTERAFARQRGVRGAAGGVIHDMAPVFGDQRLPQRHALQRGGAPLAPLLFLYPTTIVFLPPTDQRTLEARAGMPLEYLVELQHHNVVLPILGHPADYAELSHFDPILNMRPPSLWARGDEVAHVYGCAAEHWTTARAVLPFERILEVPWVREKWSAHHPDISETELDDRIVIEVATNFVNLCIFGWEPLARDIAQAESASALVHRLLLMNELLTYPQLMGAGGTPNYGLSRRDAITEAQSRLLADTNCEFVSAHAELLLEGLHLSVPCGVTPDAIKEFHRLDLASHLWGALEELEHDLVELRGADVNDDLECRAHDAAILLESGFREAHNIALVEREKKLSTRVRLALDVATKLGSATTIAAGAALGFNLPAFTAALAGISTAAFVARLELYDHAAKALDARILDALLRRGASGLATQIWWLEKSRAQRA